MERHCHLRRRWFIATLVMLAVAAVAGEAWRASTATTHHFIDTDAQDGAKQLAALGGAKLIVCTAPNSEAIAALMPGLGHGGEMIIIAYVSEPLALSPSVLMRGSRTIRGWVGGDMEDALRFGVLTGVRPIIESFPLAHAQLAYARMLTSKIHFRGVLIP